MLLLWMAVLPLAAMSQELSEVDAPVALEGDSMDTSSNDAKQVVVRAIDEPSDPAENFSVYIGTIDGVRRIVFQEVEGGSDGVLADNGVNPSDPFGAYDDIHIINSEHEKTIFVPKPYRPGQKKEEESPPPQTTKAPSPPPPTTRRPAPTARPTQPFVPRRPETTVFRPQPAQPSPARVLPPRVQTTRPAPAATQPPPPPPPTRPPPTTAPAPFTGDPTGLRSGQCANSIFYISTPINGPTRLTFTHFAIAVTVDQCARTCHEFNCAIAHYNPINGHCEFNPSTAFAIRNGQCPAWPSLHYRNNVVASEPVRIFCVTCQKPRRRINRGHHKRSPFNFSEGTMDEE